MNSNPSFNILSGHILTQAYPDSYPSPSLSESEFVSNADSSDLPTSELWFNDLLTESQDSPVIALPAAKPNRKRKSSDPHRSVAPPMVRSNSSSTIRLDTFSAYLMNPSFLLYPLNARSHRESCTSSSDTHAHHRYGVAKAVKSLPEFYSRGFHVDPRDGTGWLDMNAYKDTSNAPPVVWKRTFFSAHVVAGSHKLFLTQEMPGLSELTPEEQKLCSIVRIMPDVYLHLKRSLLSAVFTYGPFKKRDAQLWFKMDVNKSSFVYDWFKGLGWIPRSDQEWPIPIPIKDPVRDQAQD